MILAMRRMVGSKLVETEQEDSNVYRSLRLVYEGRDDVVTSEKSLFL